jgi:RimJ/RimL family protein N-acetyltransferase
MARFTEHVDRVWAGQLGLAPDELHAEPVRVVLDAPGFANASPVFVLDLGGTRLIAARSHLADAAHAIAAGRAVQDVADDIGGTVFGPSWHGYLHRDDHEPAPPTTRALTEDDIPALDALRAAVPDDEWAEGGFAAPHRDDVLWGSFDATGALVAAGNLTDFGGAPADVGLVTHPSARGRGHAARLTADMCTWAFAHTDVVRYRALTTNAPSLAVARRAGFAGYGENVVIRTIAS